MKQYPRLMICFLFVFIVRLGYSQQITEQQAKEMAKRMMTMTPSQMMKFKDSLMNAVMKQQAKTLPNGNQLLIAHHYDTTYTTVSFNYTKKVSQNFGGSAGTETYLVYGKSLKAPMIYEANGHTIIKCNMNTPGANTDAINKMAKDINSKVKYMKPQQAAEATDDSRQMAFASLAVNDNSLTGVASDNGLYSGGGGNTIITTRPPVKMMSFFFSYDPVEVLSSIAVGAQINRHTVSNAAATPYRPAESSSTDDTEGLGLNASTDPKDAKIVGATTMQSNPDDAYIKVTKTPRGFKIQYTKIQHIRDNNTDITETLTATIGEPEQQYVAVIKPFGDVKYEDWVPKGPKVDGSNDKKGNDELTFCVTVADKKDPTKLYAGNFTVKYRLRNITHYKGFNSNYPLIGNNPDYSADLKFADDVDRNTETFDHSLYDDSTAVSNDGKGRNAVVRIMCMDYGAWGKLIANVTLDDGTPLEVAPYYAPDSNYISIPFDRNNNKIADAWETSEHILDKNYDLKWDEDVLPDNHHNGDNIPLIDEYRGFLVEDDSFNPIYKRLSPNVKELFTIGLADKTNNGKLYKQTIRNGALSYGQMTDVTVYHFTSARYGQREMGDNFLFGRWVNYNSPSGVHTHGVTIYAYDTANPDGKLNTLASTKPINGSAPDYNGAQTPDETEMVLLWTYNLTTTNDQIAKSKDWYLPANKDNFHVKVDPHILHINAKYHLNFDPNTFSTVVTANAGNIIQQMIANTVAHELCHATNIHHHHFSTDLEAAYIGSFQGVSSCPVRYWGDWTQENEHADWLTMFLAGKWDPSSGKTPDGVQMRLCTSDDNCFSQLKLKK